MAKRQSPEDRIVDYFQTAPQQSVEMLFGIIKGIVKRRHEATNHEAVPKKQRRGRRKKAAAAGNVTELSSEYAATD